MPLPCAAQPPGCADPAPPLYMRVHLRLSQSFLTRFPAWPREHLLRVLCRLLEIPFEACTALHVWEGEEDRALHIILDLTIRDALADGGEPLMACPTRRTFLLDNAAWSWPYSQ